MGGDDARNPGEYPTRWVKRSPLDTPSDRAYEAPSENPPNAMRAGSMRTRSNVYASARSSRATSGPNPPMSMRSQVDPRESVARNAIPHASARSG